MKSYLIRSAVIATVLLAAGSALAIPITYGNTPYYVGDALFSDQSMAGAYGLTASSCMNHLSSAISNHLSNTNNISVISTIPCHMALYYGFPGVAFRVPLTSKYQVESFLHAAAVLRAKYKIDDYDAELNKLMRSPVEDKGDAKPK